MRETVTVNARIDSKTKTEASKILAALGMSISQAVSVFFKQIVHTGGIPFEVKLPNKVTLEAVKQAKTGKGLVTFDSVDELLQDLET